MRSSELDTSVTRVDVDGDIATIVFNRPDKRNAMNDALVDALDPIEEGNAQDEPGAGLAEVGVFLVADGDADPAAGAIA